MKKTLLTLLLSVSIGTVSAQTSENVTNNTPSKKAWKEKIYTGGNIGLSLGVNTNILVSPIIGYKFTEKYSAGIGLNYNYLSVNGNELHLYGGSIFNRYIVSQEIFLQGEFETLTYKRPAVGDIPSSQITAPAILVGGGYRKSLGGRASASVIVLYDLLQHENSPYDSGLVVRGGIGLGF